MRYSDDAANAAPEQLIQCGCSSSNSSPYAPPPNTWDISTLSFSRSAAMPVNSSGTATEKENKAAFPKVSCRVVRLRRMISLGILWLMPNLDTGGEVNEGTGPYPVAWGRGTVCCMLTRRSSRSLKSLPIPPVPDETARVDH